MSNSDIRTWYRGAIPPGANSPLQLVMIQSTSFCNINCSYCYLPLRSNKARFDLQLIPTLIERLDEAGLLDRRLTISWHAGEPLVLPVGYYREAKKLFDQHAPADLEIRHSFQTNAMLLSDEYASFFAEIEALVGVSIDGPSEIHDVRRRTRDGQGTFERAMTGYKRLRQHGVRASTISVLTAESLEKPDLLYDFFKDLDVTEAGFNIEEIEGENVSSSLSPPEMEDKTRAFFRRMHERVSNDPSPLRIRELENGRSAAISNFMGGPGGSSENNPLSIISIDTEGRVSTFSPELLQVHGETDAYTFGQISTIDFSKLWQNNRFVDINAQVQDGVAKCRAECSYFLACRGGAPANKLAENGTFASSETMHCRLSKKAVIDVMEDVMLDQLKRRREERRLRLNEPREASLPPPRLAPAQERTQGSPVIAAAAALKLFGSSPVKAASSVKRVARTTMFPYLGSINVLAPRDRIRIADGTEPAPTTSNYKGEAVVPLSSWRECTAQEFEALQSGARSPAPFNYVALVALPPALRESALRLGESLAGSDKIGLVREPTQTDERLSQAISTLFGEPAPQQTLGLLVQDGGKLTTTVDPDDEKRLGLHVDSWIGAAPDARMRSPNRIAVNLGRSARHLLVIDLSYDQILNLSADQAGVRPENRNPTDVARDFLRRYPQYPVISIEVRPGEAYIAATENVVHDGCTIGAEECDVVLTILGKFDRRSISHFLVQTEPVSVAR